MALSVDDLKPKPFKVNIKGVELTSKPVRLSHAMRIARVGNVLENAQEATTEQIKQAQAEIDEVFAELIPELEGKELDMSVTIDLIKALMETVEPSENKELKENNVEVGNTNPKAQKTG